MEESYLISQERCPECAKVGKDRSGNNLAIYSDGHVHCFSCGYHVPPSGVYRFKSKNRNKELANEPTHSEIYLPTDCDVNYPARALEWVGQYELTKTDLLNNNALWSEKVQRLIFPVYGDSGLLAYQGRYFGPPSTTGKPYPKWYGKGDLKNCFNLLGSTTNNKLILTEDILSSIKCSKFTLSMPLYGSHISSERWKRLKLLGYDEVHIFLDPDKRQEAIKFGRQGKLFGINTHIIIADADPKDIPYKNLKELL